MTPAEAEASLAEWAQVDRSRDDRIRAARLAGLSKHRIHVLTGVARTTIDKIIRQEADDSMATHVIMDSVTGDTLSVPLTLEHANYVANRERNLAAEQGRPCSLAVVAMGSEERGVREAARRRMSGNPPRSTIIYDGSEWPKSQEAI